MYPGVTMGGCVPSCERCHGANIENCVCVSQWMCGCGYNHAMIHMWQSENSFWESYSLPLWVLKTGQQVRFVWPMLLSTEPSHKSSQTQFLRLSLSLNLELPISDRLSCQGTWDPPHPSSSVLRLWTYIAMHIYSLSILCGTTDMNSGLLLSFLKKCFKLHCVCVCVCNRSAILCGYGGQITTLWRCFLPYHVGSRDWIHWTWLQVPLLAETSGQPAFDLFLFDLF